MIKFDSVSYIHPNGIKALDDINLKIKSINNKTFFQKAFGSLKKFSYIY